MADNVELNAGTGGAILATDDVGGVHYQINKLAYGALDSATLVSTSNPLPISDAGGSLTIDGTVAVSGTVAVTDNASSLTIDAPVGTPAFVRLSDGSAAITTLAVSLATVPSHAVTNAGTFAVQAAQSGNWNSRTQDGSGNAVTSATRGAERALTVQVVDASGNQVTSFSGSGTSSAVSTANSSTATLLAAAAFTGTSEDISLYASVTVAVISNVASATDGLSMQQSSDGTNWDIADVYTVPAATGKTFGVQVAAKFFRVVYTNGGTNQASFRLQTIFHTNMPNASSVRPQDARTNDNDMQEVIGYLSGFNGTTWDRLRSDTTNGLDVDVTRVGGTVAVTQSGAWSLTANQSVNVAQINGVTALMGNGVTGTGSQRVTIASDNTAFSVNATLQASTNTNEVVGDVAHDAPIGGNPVRLAGRALTADYTAVAAGDAADLITTLLGKLVTIPYANPANTWSSAAASGGIVNTTGVTAKAAGGAGVRNYITHVDVVNGHATVDTDVQIRDGASGTVLWRGFAKAAGGGVAADFNPPLRGTAATLVEIACGTTGTATYFNLQGFSAAE